MASLPISPRPFNYSFRIPLTERTSYAPKSVYNMISQRIFTEGVHYFKPTKRKLLFFWPAVEAWIREGHNGRTEQAQRIDQARQ
jgi:hypothetical protein